MVEVVDLLVAVPLPPRLPETTNTGRLHLSSVVMGAGAPVVEPGRADRRTAAVRGVRRVLGRLAVEAEGVPPAPVDVLAALASGSPRLAARALRLLRRVGGEARIDDNTVYARFKNVKYTVTMRSDAVYEPVARSAAPAAPEDWPGGSPLVELYAEGPAEDAWELLEKLEETLPPPQGLVHVSVPLTASRVERWATPLPYTWTGILEVSAGLDSLYYSSLSTEPVHVGRVRVKTDGAGVLVELTPENPAPGLFHLDWGLLTLPDNTAGLMALIAGLPWKQGVRVRGRPTTLISAGTGRPAPQPVLKVSSLPPPGTPRLRAWLPAGAYLRIAAPDPAHYMKLMQAAAAAEERVYRLLAQP